MQCGLLLIQMETQHTMCCSFWLCTIMKKYMQRVLKLMIRGKNSVSCYWGRCMLEAIPVHHACGQWLTSAFYNDRRLFFSQCMQWAGGTRPISRFHVWFQPRVPVWHCGLRHYLCWVVRSGAWRFRNCTGVDLKLQKHPDIWCFFFCIFHEEDCFLGENPKKENT